jgi:hypothetical protein
MGSTLALWHRRLGRSFAAAQEERFTRKKPITLLHKGARSYFKDFWAATWVKPDILRGC